MCACKQMVGVERLLTTYQVLVATSYYYIRGQLLNLGIKVGNEREEMERGISTAANIL